MRGIQIEMKWNEMPMDDDKKIRSEILIANKFKQFKICMFAITIPIGITSI